MKIDYLIYILLFLNILVADTYWFLPFVLPSVLLIWPIFALGTRHHLLNVSYNWKLFKPFLYFITYIFVVKIVRQEDLIVSTYLYASQIVTIIIALYLKEKPHFLAWYLQTFIIANLAIQLIQIGGLHINAGDLLSPFGFKEYREVGLFDSTRGFRFSGLFTSVVPLGFISGVSCAFFWILYNQTAERKHLLLAFLGLLVSVLTNTRAVLYSIVPIIFFVNYVVWKRVNIRLIMLCFVFIGFYSILQSNSGYEAKNSSVKASNWNKDGGIIDRVQGNVYGTVGTLAINPLFGVSEKQQGKAIIEGHKRIGLFFGTYFINHVTYHNLPLYYLRIYGIIGFIVFVYFYWSAIKFALRQKDPYDSQYMLTVLLFFFAYNLSHNMKPDYLVFWLALCASYKSYRNNLNDTEYL